MSLTAGVIPVPAQQPRQLPTPQLPPVDSFFPFELRPAEVTLPRDSVDVPLDVADGRPTVMVMINGRGPFRFAVETGAPLVTLRAAVAEAIGYSATESSQWVELDSLCIGAAAFRRVRAKLFSRRASQAFGSKDLGGLLGLNVYYDVLLTLDPAHHRAKFTRGTLPPVNHRDIVPIEPLAQQWYTMESWINGTRGMAFVDTQDPSTFSVVPSQVTDSQFVVPPVVIGITSGPSLGTQITRVGRFNGNIRVGRVNFLQPMARIMPIPSESMQRWIIGWGALQHFTMTLDQRQRRVRLTSVDSMIVPPPSLFDVGLQWRGDEATGYRIVALRAGGPAERQGLTVGDELVSFNEVPLTAATSEQLRSLFQGPSPVRLSVRRNTTIQTVLLKPEILVP